MARPPERPLEDFEGILARFFSVTGSKNARQFAKAIDKDPSTVSKAINARRTPQSWYDADVSGFNATEQYLRYGEKTTPQNASQTASSGVPNPEVRHPEKGENQSKQGIPSTESDMLISGNPITDLGEVMADKTVIRILVDKIHELEAKIRRLEGGEDSAEKK